LLEAELSWFAVGINEGKSTRPGLKGAFPLAVSSGFSEQELARIYRAG